MFAVKIFRKIIAIPMILVMTILFYTVTTILKIYGLAATVFNLVIMLCAIIALVLQQWNNLGIDYSIQESPVEYFKCFYNFVLSLEKCDTKELVDISINNVVGIEEGKCGINFSKYYFVIPKQETLDTLAFEEKLGKDKSDIEYDKRRLIVNL